MWQDIEMIEIQKEVEGNWITLTKIGEHKLTSNGREVLESNYNNKYATVNINITNSCCRSHFYIVHETAFS